MKEAERIALRKIYVGKVGLFGLLFGLVLGIITAIVLIVLFLMDKAEPLADLGLPLAANEFYLFSGFLILVFAIGMFFVCIIGALIYNFLALIKCELHLGLAETEGEPEPMANIPGNVRVEVREGN